MKSTFRLAQRIGDLDKILPKARLKYFRKLDVEILF